MGLVLGRVTVEQPKYTVVSSGTNYEVREYPPAVVAEVQYEGAAYGKNQSDPFRTLAKYIGVFGTPENESTSKPESGEKIAMTAPVITETSESKKEKADGEKIAMTAPVITADSSSGSKKESIMQFVLPEKYTMDNAPKPKDPRVSIKELPARKLGVIKFSGNATEELTAQKETELREALGKAGLKVTGTPTLVVRPDHQLQRE
eukprot:TRINITY_DN10919_c0_g3_i1.p1 TRINITY_DN10919_c0_g3~~TRINITY_DN10919_c0_g3_i1.p1  ORF type:complete len:204 (+),score=53.14 TRINITY_DN10919_c0_g3_i1:190-801(+)